MVLIVILGLNGQNKEGRSLFDKGSTNSKKWGQTPNKNSYQTRDGLWQVWIVWLKKLTTAGQLNGSLETTIIGLHFTTDSMRLSSLKFLWRVHSRSSKVIDFGTNWKCACDLLLVRHSKLGPILHRFGGIAGFCPPDPPLFHPNYGGVPGSQAVAVRGL